MNPEHSFAYAMWMTKALSKQDVSSPVQKAMVSTMFEWAMFITQDCASEVGGRACNVSLGMLMKLPVDYSRGALKERPTTITAAELAAHWSEWQKRIEAGVCNIVNPDYVRWVGQNRAIQIIAVSKFGKIVAFYNKSMNSILKPDQVLNIHWLSD